MSKVIYSVSFLDENLRIDRYLAAQNDKLSRNYIQKLIKCGNLKVNEVTKKANYVVKENDLISFEVPDQSELFNISPENIALDILFEDSEIIVINKKKGMVVHPSSGHFTGTVVNALLNHCQDLSGINGILRPGIVHRIDKDTSGVIVCAKTDTSHKNLAKQFEEHSINRIYEAIVCGNFNDEVGMVCFPIGRKTNDRKMMGFNPNGKPATTHYKVIKNYKNYAHIECKLETGRTHQIRVHLTSINHPLVGDQVYGGKRTEYKLGNENVIGQALHARLLGFNHPITGEYMEFTAPRPEYFDQILEKLENTSK